MTTLKRPTHRAATIAAIAHLVLVLVSVGNAHAQSAAPDSAQSGITPSQRITATMPALDALTMSRAQMARALGPLDTDVAAAIVEPIFKEYAAAIGSAREAALDRLYLRRGNDADVRAVTGAELVDVAASLSAAYEAATRKALQELGESASAIGRSPELTRQDLLRTLVARYLQFAVTGGFDKLSPGYDTLLEYDAARADDPAIGTAAAKADLDAQARAALEPAIEEYRRQAASLGEMLMQYSGVLLATSRTNWDGLPEPHEFAERRRARDDASAVWRRMNDELADAFERHLLVAGDPLAAARWRLRVYEITASKEVPMSSWFRRAVAVAHVLGLDAEEIEALRAMEASYAPQRLAKVRASLSAYRRWFAELNGDLNAVGSVDPPQALERAIAAQEAFEADARARILQAVRSRGVRDALASHVPPAVEADAPYWLQAWRARIATAAPNVEEKPQ
ncbi:MAG: hypothetical protein JNM94_08325 [Phycisphaerae bacterium]|nr:hypothetical protein [Phycisphaerae bacterium]